VLRTIDTRRGLAILAAVAAAAGAVSLLQGGLAEGEARLSSCPAKYVCVYEDANLTGQKVKLGPKRGLTNRIAEKLNNEASSATSSRANAAIIYAGKNGKGDSRCIDGGDVQNFAAMSFDDVASSARLTRRDSCIPG
jgi:hypothetical protein